MANSSFQSIGKNAAAPFRLKIHRGEGMALLAMNWRSARPPRDFVGFAIEFREPGGTKFIAVQNRLNFLRADGSVDDERRSTLESPIQKFRWLHFPTSADQPGLFRYRVTPVFMDAADKLAYGEVQEADIELRRETYPGKLNVAFTRGYISSQYFVDQIASGGPVSTLLPPKADRGLTFVPTHPKRARALRWMGFEARSVLLDLLDEAVADADATVRMVAYDLNEPLIVKRLEALGPRLRIVIDDEGEHGEESSAETQAEHRLAASAGAANVKRQHLGKLQHNKTIVVDGPRLKAVLCGSTNFSWRGLYVQSNNAVVLRGRGPVQLFGDAFETYWDPGTVAGFGRSAAAQWAPLRIGGIDGQVTFSPHAAQGAALDGVAADIEQTQSTLFYSLAFLAQTPGAVRQALSKVTKNPDRYVYGLADREVGGVDLLTPDGKRAPLSPGALSGNVPPPFKEEPTGGGGVRMHHKFVVVDFDKPTARVYFGSYNFSKAADRDNGENLLLVRDRRVATSYMVEAMRMFDHYSFRVARETSRQTRRPLALRRPPRLPGETAWWERDYADPHRSRDRLLFSS